MTDKDLSPGAGGLPPAAEPGAMAPPVAEFAPQSAASSAAQSLIDMRFLREFTVIAQEGSVRRAAVRLGTAASVVSRKISDAEIRLGVKLFERDSRGMRLTEAGQVLREHALHMRDEQDYVLDRLSQFTTGNRAVLRIMMGEGFVDDLMHNGLRILAAQMPQLRYDMHLAGTNQMLDAVVEGRTDIAIAYNPILRAETRSLAIGRQALCVVVHPRSALAGRHRVTLAEALAQPTAILNHNHAIHQLVARAASDSGLAFTPVVLTDSIAMSLRFVSAGLGVTFVPRFSATVYEERGELVILDVDEPLLSNASAHLIVRARRRLPRSVDVAATFFAAHLQAFR